MLLPGGRQDRVRRQRMQQRRRAPPVDLQRRRQVRRHADVVHAKVDTDAERELAATVGIRSVPTIMAFRDGILVYSQAGAMPPAVLEDLIGKVKGLDMNAVRAQIAQRKAAASA